MSLLTLPQARIPIGSVMVNGRPLPVIVDMEWMRAFLTIFDRVGGANGLSTTDVDAGSFAAMQPATSDASTGVESIQFCGAEQQFQDVFQADSVQSVYYLPMQA